MKELECFLCRTIAKVTVISEPRLATIVICPLCGQYKIDEFAEQAVKENEETRYALAWIIRDLAAAGKAVLKYEDIGDLVAQGLAKEPTPSGKGRRILEAVKKASRYFGELVQLDPGSIWPRVKCRGQQEYTAIVLNLKEKGWLAKLTNPDAGMMLTWDGWELLAPTVGGSKDVVFVAMQYSEDMNSAFAAIKSAVERAKMIPIRMDKEIFLEKICERMLNEIHRAEYVIAEVTHHNPGVYFEAGYAMSLGKKVIFLCHDGDFKHRHFDTRQYPHLIWKEPEDLTSQLEDKLNYLKNQRDAIEASSVTRGSTLTSAR
jgi:nucleoside 2-deoxyribosyltransferase